MNKKLSLIATLLIIWWVSLIWITNAQNWWFWDNTLVSGYSVPWAQGSWLNSSGTSKLLDVVQTTVNRVLWMLSLIALILCLWGWFQMLTAGSDDWKVKSGTKILKNAALWLAIIWLSWLFVSFIFRIINKVSG